MLYEFTDLYNKESGLAELKAEELKTKIILIHDAVFVLYKALTKIEVSATKLSCENVDAWPYGSTLSSFMKTVNKNIIIFLLILVKSYLYQNPQIYKLNVLRDKYVRYNNEVLIQIENKK